jgi:hypothetical protein
VLDQQKLSPSLSSFEIVVFVYPEKNKQIVFVFFNYLRPHILLRDCLTQIRGEKKMVSDFGYLRACRFKKITFFNFEKIDTIKIKFLIFFAIFKKIRKFKNLI